MVPNINTKSTRNKTAKLVFTADTYIPERALFVDGFQFSDNLSFVIISA